MLRRAGYWLATATVLYALWFLFVATLSPEEWVVGAGASALAATGVEVVRGLEHPRFWPQARWLLEFRRVPWQILKDCWILLRRLAAGNRDPGFFATAPFDASGPDARSVARRALAITFTTVTPNMLVVGISRHERLMLVHQLEPQDVPGFVRRLGSEAAS